jgi:DNA modification methylase
MQIKKTPVKDLVSPEWNPRQITNEELEKLKTSLEEFGYIEPIIINDVNNHVVGGNQRLRALTALGYDEVDCVYVHIEDINKEKACNVALNKISGDWDEDKLRTVLEDIELSPIDIKLTGFEELELTELEVKEPVTVHEDDFNVEDEEDIEVNVKTGDLFKLGNHFLLCGDSTVEANVKKLMQGAKADISFTSPPYNADHMDIPLSNERGGGTQKSTQKKYLADNDKKTDEEYFKFLCQNMDLLLTYSDEIFYNIGVASGSKIAITKLLNHYSSQFKELMYWIKDNPMPVIHENVISSSTELIICFGEKGTRSFNNFNDRLFHGVIQGLSASTTNKYADVHKATFPIYLPSEIIKRFTNENGSVLDCFGGTGTTLIACEQLNRRCYMIELEPVYCQIIINRWEQYTGEKATKIN